MPKNLSGETVNPQPQLATRQVNGVSLTVFFVFIAGAILTAAILDNARIPDGWIALIAAALVLIGVYFLFALKIANEWEKVVVLRFGKFRGLRGPGLFWVVPVMDTIAAWVDTRVIVTPFAAEKTLTQDLVGVGFLPCKS